ncbi:hypothetical protein ACF3OJ_06000 [Cardiobacterium hominis]|uniref:hypothetical protein n=1 Tax=Cardiobacterium hominis TaxID=2718 RepID=UPI00370D7B41
MEALDAALTTIRVAVGDAPYNVNFFAHGLWQAEQLAGRRIILACNDFDLIKAGVAAETGIGLLPISMSAPKTASCKSVSTTRRKKYNSSPTSIW